MQSQDRPQGQSPQSNPPGIPGLRSSHLPGRAPQPASPQPPAQEPAGEYDLAAELKTPQSVEIGAGADQTWDTPVDPDKPRVLVDTQLPEELLIEGQAPSMDPAAQVQMLSPRHKLEAWLAEMVRLNASDLILRADGRPSCRIDGRIHFLPGKVPAAGPLMEVLEGIIGKARMSGISDSGSVDSAMMLDGLGRFRMNAYKQLGEPAIVLRRVSGEPPLLSSLHLPTQQLERLALRKRGLILVTGIAGSGKSTALAAMIQYMNSACERHIVTLEDPIEVLFKEDRCVISQREVGTDCPSFELGLRHALRQSPDAILIGEMRDAETVGAALDATETGHLVMSTLHTVNAPQTVDRILSFFPGERHDQVRQRLAENLAAVMSLRLLPRKSGKGMVPAVELLLSTPRVRELLYDGMVTELSRVVEAGADEGLVSFNQSLRILLQQDLIELEVALSASDRPEELLLALRGFSKGSKGQLSIQGPTSRLRLAGGE